MRRYLAILMGGLMLALAGFALAEVVFSDSTYTADEPVEPSPEKAEAPAGDGVEILITAAGDVTLGGNMRKNPKSNMYTDIIKKTDGDLSYFFANVQDYFATDDMTIVNFEGTLTTATDHVNNSFCFRAPPEHVKVLTLGSVEAVAFENNHVMDFRQQGYDDTIAALDGEEIVYSATGDIGIYDVKGVRIGMLAYQTFDGAYDMIHERMPEDITMARMQGCQIVIVSYHWGEELDYAPHDRQIALGRATVDAGADLVLGHHSHRINPIERYNGKYIVYSLANCSFSGNTGPADMDTFLFQQKFTVTGDAAVSGAFRIVPASISSSTAASGSKTGVNDLAVTPFASGSEAARRVVDTLLKNGRKLDYAVTAYPTDWQ